MTLPIDTIIQGDCLEVMAGWPDGCVDVVITDAPYGIGDAPLDKEGGTAKRAGRTSVNTWPPPSTWDATINPEWCDEVSRIAPVVAWFGHWRKREEVAAAMRHSLRAEII